MKNIFKFMGIALMACSLTMVACNKDDKDSKTNDSTTPVNPGQDTTPVNPGQDTTVTPPTQGTITINFNGIDQNLAYKEGNLIDFSNATLFQTICAAGVNGSNYELPLFYSAVVNFNGQWRLSDQLQYEDGSSLADDYPNCVIDGYEDEWDPERINSIEYGNFDATTNVFSFNYDLQMYNYDQFWSNLSAILAAAGITTAEQVQALDSATYYNYAMQADSLTSRADYHLNVQNYIFATASSK